VTKTTRRQFLKKSALVTAGFWLGSRFSLAPGMSPSEKLNIGCIGVANRAHANIEGVKGENIVALCDIDDSYLASASKTFPDAKTYNDFRLLLDQKDVEAVVVSTPDHIHAPAGIRAMRSGRHVYCEKPLAHNVWEARKMAETAARCRVATQMGTQIHNDISNYRRVVELVQTGAIGAVKEAHVWVGKAWGGGDQPDRPAQPMPVPSHIHYDLWLGPAPERPYHSTYLPANWRRWWDFGNGTLGDMGCHYMDLPFWALKLRHPTTVETEGPPLHPERTSPGLIVRYEFPARGDLPPVKMTWYDGGKRPGFLAERKIPEWGAAVLFIGQKGMLIADYGNHKLLPEDQYADFKRPDPTIPDSIGHHAEWFQACKTGSPTTCNFDYSGTLAEAVLLGNVAHRAGKKLQWDHGQLKAVGCPEADPLIHKSYREGWKL